MAQSENVVLVTGAAGWLGSLVSRALTEDPKTPDVRLILADVVEPNAPSANAIVLKTDLTDPSQVTALFQTAYGVPDTVYCLHGIMSRGSEDNFDLGLQVNVESIRSVLDAARHCGAAVGRPIKFIFTSSLAVYGGTLPDVVTPTTIATPESAYGTGKLISELLINEYTRRGYIDGRILRLPTIVVRPGAPSAATSSFLSGIIREPLHGKPSVCPIGDSLDSPALELAAWLASPTTTIRNLVRAKHVPVAAFLPHTRVVCAPGFTATVREMLAALDAVGGKEALARVNFKDDPVNRRVVSSWPARFDNTYALGLGFTGDQGGMRAVVESFAEEVKAGRA
ncbi:NAD P-binding protein [Sparassis crispa]|uniref:NAD P-binding protein n=1 Tax=Sparassis crispa TaxID=139825 RepID=A0A401GXR5_9APHY|nr:NAD P-binding protein [Sparassis crispa]GBE86997.1 NAD P-binding protein [Sparassis crispa]